MQSKTTVVARKSIPYDGVLYRPGDRISMLPAHAKLLVAMGSVNEVADAPELDEIFDIGVAPQPQLTRRQRRQQYSTRELRAREV